MLTPDEIMETLRKEQIMPSRVRIEANDKTSKIVFYESEWAMQKTAAKKPCNILEKKKHKKYGKIVTPITLLNESRIPLTEFDRAVKSVCDAEYVAGNKCATINTIYRALVGKVGKVGVVPSPTVRRQIKSSLLKLMGTIVSIDISDSYEKLKYANGDRLKCIKSSILPCCFVEAIVNGQPVEAIFFDRESPLFTVADMKNQVVRYGASLIDVPHIKGTALNISLTNCVMRRVCEIKLHRQLTPTITFDDIYKKCGIENSSRRVKYDARDTVIRLFQNLVDKHFIDSFEIVKSKSVNKIHAISFKFTPPAESNITTPATDNSVTDNSATNDSSDEKNEEKPCYSNSGTCYSSSGTCYSSSGTCYSNSGTLRRKKSRRKARHNQQSSNTAKIA